MLSLRTRIGLIAAALVTATLAGAGTAHAQVAPTLTIDPVASFDAATGSATVTGTYSCGDTSGTGLIEVTLQQRVGRIATVTGSGFFDITCEPGAAGTWSAEVTPASGEFRGGAAFASARLVLDGVAFGDIGREVQLRGHIGS